MDCLNHGRGRGGGGHGGVRVKGSDGAQIETLLQIRREIGVKRRAKSERPSCAADRGLSG